eukprot:Hpha_TRINITY_DN18719_c0_g1::TRINITY_DN18719_c0_g1_i1::g.47441::m.47441
MRRYNRAPPAVALLVAALGSAACLVFLQNAPLSRPEEEEPGPTPWKAQDRHKRVRSVRWDAEPRGVEPHKAELALGTPQGGLQGWTVSRRNPKPTQHPSLAESPPPLPAPATQLPPPPARKSPRPGRRCAAANDALGEGAGWQAVCNLAKGAKEPAGDGFAIAITTYRGHDTFAHMFQ